MTQKPGSAAIVVLVAAILVSTSSAATLRASGISPRERAWIASLVPLTNDLSAFSNAVARLSPSPKILVRGSDEQRQLGVALAGLRTCAPTLKRKGPVPSERLKPLRAQLASACDHYGRVATLMIRGLDELSVSLIRAAATQMGLGTEAILRARRVALALR